MTTVLETLTPFNEIFQAIIVRLQTLKQHFGQNFSDFSIPIIP